MGLIGREALKEQVAFHVSIRLNVVWGVDSSNALNINLFDCLTSFLLLFLLCLLLGGHLARQVHGTGLASQGFLVRCNTGSRVVGK